MEAAVRIVNQWILGFCLFAGSVLFSAAQEPVGLDALEALVKQWSDLRLTLADEERAWEQQKEAWRREVSLLRLERDRLRSSQEGAQSAQSDAEAEHMAQLHERDRLKALLEALPPLVTRAEAHLGTWSLRIPAVLRAPLEPAFRPLPEGASLSARLQRVIALYTEIEQLQHRIHVHKEILSTGDARREVDVCYLGLARAFAVAKDDSWAAIGTPGENGWQWTPRPEAAGKIRAAISVYQREHSLELVPLPLQVREDAR